MDDRKAGGGPLSDFDPLANELPPAGSQPLGPGEDQILAGRYRLGEMLSVGGVGAVYDAVDAETGRAVVVKLLQWWEDNHHALARFRTEAESARALRHPNIVEVLDIRQSDGLQYFVMEKIAGQDLAYLLKGGKRLHLATVGSITAQLVSALSAVHEAGIVHRDLKPANVIVDDVDGPHPTVKLIDFGVAKVLGGDQRLTGRGHVLGALGYMPPEQASGQSSEADLRSDVYALGAIIYRMIAGRAPIDGRNVAEFAENILTKSPPPLRDLATVSDALSEVVMRALAKRPEDRFPSMAAFWAALSPTLTDR